MQPQAQRIHTLKAVQFQLARRAKPTGPPLRLRLRVMLTVAIFTAAILALASRTADSQTIPPPPGACIRLATGQTVWQHPDGSTTGAECLPPNILFPDAE